MRQASRALPTVPESREGDQATGTTRTQTVRADAGAPNARTPTPSRRRPGPSCASGTSRSLGDGRKARARDMRLSPPEASTARPRRDVGRVRLRRPAGRAGASRRQLRWRRAPCAKKGPTLRPTPLASVSRIRRPLPLTQRLAIHVHVVRAPAADRPEPPSPTRLPSIFRSPGRGVGSARRSEERRLLLRHRPRRPARLPAPKVEPLRCPISRRSATFAGVMPPKEPSARASPAAWRPPAPMLRPTR